MTANIKTGDRPWLALVPAGIAVLALFYVMSMAGRGLDLTDESSYLNWIARPDLYPHSVTQYGSVYHPLWRAFGGDIAALRQFNILALFGLGSALGWSLLPRASLVTRLALAPMIGFVALLGLKNWLATPSYNTLNLQGLMIATIALFIIANDDERAPRMWRTTTGAVLLGIGGWLVFLAKPTSAALLAVPAVAFLLAIDRLESRIVPVAAATASALLLATALAIDGSVAAFVARISDAASATTAMDAKYTAAAMFRLDRPQFPLVEWGVLLALTVAATATLVVLQSANRTLRMLALSVLAAALAAGLATLMGFIRPVDGGWSDRYALQMTGVVMGMVAAQIWFARADKRGWPGGDTLARFALLLFLPYVFAFGTNINYWAAFAMAGVFWAGAAVGLAYGRSGASATGAATLSLAIALIVTGIAFEYPYRQRDALTAQQETVRIGTGSTLKLGSDPARYLAQLRDLAGANGFEAGTPLIDLTGHYPIAPIALDGVAVGQAWMIGGYPGSNALATRALRRVPCAQLASAWLLVEENGPRVLSPDVLGLAEPRFQLLGPILSPTGSYDKRYRHYLMRPRHDAIAVARQCLGARRPGDKPRH